MSGEAGMEVRLEITSLVFGGAGMGRIPEGEAGGLAGKVVFVPFTAPGDEVTARITRDTKGFSEAEVINILSPSPARTLPVCPVFGECGGCSYQHITYQEEVAWKGRIFIEALERIGRLSPGRVDPPVPSPEPYHYRLRARFHARGTLWGFFAHRTNNVVDIEACPLVHPLINDAFRDLKRLFTTDTALRKAAGRLDAVEIGASLKDMRPVARLSFNRGPLPEAGRVLEGAPALKGVELLSGEENPKVAVKKSEGDIRLLYQAGGFDFAAPIGAFSQVNGPQNEALIKKVVEYAADPSGGPPGAVLDLYSGVGNLTIPLAASAPRTVGVESDEEAVAAALGNAGANLAGGHGEVEFVRNTALGWLKGETKGLERAGVDVVVLDPPRGGDRQAAQTIAGMRPRKVVYVSCNPPTLARDLLVLKQSGYRPARACLIDMFPRTSSLEGVVLMERGAERP